MITTNTLLKISLTKAEKAHSILQFLYDVKKRKTLLKDIKNNLLPLNENNEINREYITSKVIDSYRFVKEVKKKIKQDTDKIKIFSPN